MMFRRIYSYFRKFGVSCLKFSKAYNSHLVWTGIYSGYKDKNHKEKEALRDKVRTYRERALRSEEALEAVSAQLESKVCILF